MVPQMGQVLPLPKQVVLHSALGTKVVISVAALVALLAVVRHWKAVVPSGVMPNNW